LSVTEKELDKYRIRQGDILINRVSKKPEGVGKAVLVSHLNETSVYESNVMRFRINEHRIRPWYLVYYLASPNSRHELLAKANISNQASINQDIVRSLQISVPSMDLQRKFEALVERHSLANIREAAARWHAEQLFEALLLQCFSPNVDSGQRVTAPALLAPQSDETEASIA
jgi:type I restriction enzyme, S subunit